MISNISSIDYTVEIVPLVINLHSKNKFEAIGMPKKASQWLTVRLTIRLTISYDVIVTSLLHLCHFVKVICSAYERT